MLYTLGYDPYNDYMCVMTNDGNYILLLDLTCDPSEYYFQWEWELENPYDFYKVIGTINAYTYTPNAKLTNYLYTSGLYLTESEIILVVRNTISIAVSFLEYLLLSNDEIGLAIEDFGFIAYQQEDILRNDTMVWIPESGTKFHSNSNCSNMSFPKLVTLEDAYTQGYTPCGKCY